MSSQPMTTGGSIPRISRMTVFLTPEQQDYIASLALELGESPSGIVRGMIDGAIREFNEFADEASA